MAGPINVDALAEEVMKGLEEYASLAADEMKKAVRKSSTTVRKGIEERAPIRSGKYRKSWKAIKTKENASILEMTVYSPTRYMLAHLLENGHAKRGGGRVAGKPHIAPAAEAGEQQLLEEIERALRG